MRQNWACAAAAAALIGLSPLAAAQPQPSLQAEEMPDDDEVTAAADSAPASAAAVQPTAEERRRLVAASRRGVMLFELARAAQVTTRDMLSKVADPAAAGIVGWIATPRGDDQDVVYYAEGEDGPVAVYRGRVADGRVASSEVFAGAERPGLGAVERRMAAARAAVAALDSAPCGPDFNVIVIPPEAEDVPIDVYKLSPQTRRGRYPAGGHFLATVAPDGSIASSRAFTNRCLDIDVPADDSALPPPVALTHLLDPLPTEIHVFLSLWMNRPLLVATGDPERLWTVSRGRFSVVPGATAQQAPQVPPPGPGR